MAMNILYVPEWITFFDSQNFKKISKDRKSRFNPSIVHNPDYLSILVLPAKLKQAITKKIQSFEEELEPCEALLFALFSFEEELRLDELEFSFNESLPAFVVLFWELEEVALEV